MVEIWCWLKCCCDSETRLGWGPEFLCFNAGILYIYKTCPSFYSRLGCAALVLITRKASVIAAGHFAWHNHTQIRIPLWFLACVQMPKVAAGQEISSAANSPENRIIAQRLQSGFVQLTPISLKSLIIIDLLFSAQVTAPLSFSAIRLIALRTRRAGCIPGRAAGALVHKWKYCWFIARALSFALCYYTMVSIQRSAMLWVQIAIAETDSIYGRQWYDFHRCE